MIGHYVQYLFLLMLALAVVAINVARTIERSRLGYGFATIRDDELAAEACGVPTLRLKLIATTLSGAFMGMAGAPFPYYIGYVQPAAAFGLDYAVNSIAMPMIGGTTTWIGPAGRRHPGGQPAAMGDRDAYPRSSACWWSGSCWSASSSWRRPASSGWSRCLLHKRIAG